MRKLHNTLYALSEGMYLHHEGEALVAEREHHVVMRLPMHTLEGVVAVAGNVTISPHLMNRCCERGVAISYLDRNGKFLARVQGPVSGNSIGCARLKARRFDSSSAIGVRREIR